MATPGVQLGAVDLQSWLPAAASPRMHAAWQSQALDGGWGVATARQTDASVQPRPSWDAAGLMQAGQLTISEQADLSVCHERLSLLRNRVIAKAW